MISSIDVGAESGSPLTTRFARWLFESDHARPLLDAELGLLPRGVAPRYGVPLAKLTGLPPLAGKVDVLLCHPEEPRAAVVLELKCLLVSAPNTPLRLPVAELAMTVRHVNRLAEIGFSQLWLLVCLMLDRADANGSTTERPQSAQSLLLTVDEGPTLRLLHPRVGLGFVAVPFVPDPALWRTLRVLVRRPPTAVAQHARVTAMVARLLQAKTD
jgi:hypothetical protein